MKKKYIDYCSDLFRERTAKLRKNVILLLFMFFGILSAQSQVTVSGAVTGNGSYTTLSAAFTAIGTSQTGANIIVTISGNITESAPAVLGAGDWALLTITPSGGSWTISGNLASELIRFDGADNVAINGLNSGGNGLTISNTSTSNLFGTSTIKFQADATNNTITNCTLLGSATVPNSTPGAVVYFAAGTTTGNDTNRILNCNIGPAGTNLPSKLIYNNGSQANEAAGNSDITIANCNLYDYFLTAGCAAIYAAAGNSDWNITNNKFYQTSARTFTANGVMYGIYYVNTSFGSNVQITENKMGYASSAGTGTLTLLGSGFTGQFQGVFFQGSSSAAKTYTLNDNTFSNISLTSNSGNFYGIYNGVAGTNNTININGNTIRNVAAVGTTGNVIPVYAGTAATLSCNYNTIEAISRTGAGNLYGINYGAAANSIVNLNTIMDLSSTSTNSTAVIAGIYCTAAASVETVKGNRISGLTSSSTGNQNMYGIYTGSGVANKTIQNNILSNFSVPVAATGGVYGIKMSTGGSLNIVSGNTVSSFSGVNSSIGLSGIAISAGTIVNVYNNKVYGLSSAGTASAVYGFSITGGTTHNVFNNIIGDLTAPAGNNGSGAPNQVVGINVTNGVTNFNLYNNTVKISASSTGANFGTSAVSVDVNPTLIMRNNILMNTSTANGTGLSVVFRKPTLTAYNASSNNNLFYGTAIYTDGTNTDTTLGSFRTRLVNRDGLSISENPTFVSTVGSDATYLHIDSSVPTQINGGGATIASVTDDIDGDIRHATTPDIGADEFTLVTCTVAVGGTTPALGTICASGTATVAATGYTVGGGISYQWESSSDAAFTTPVAIGSVSDSYSNLTTPATTVTTYYRLKVTCAAGIPSYSTVSMINVIPNVTSTFTQVAPICSGTTLSPLPTTSNEGIAGTWSPLLNNMATTTYTFTPIAGQCGTAATMTIVVDTTPAPTGAANQNLANGQTIGNIAVNGTGVIWYASAVDAANGVNPIPASTVVNNGTYYATQTVAGCTSTSSFAVTVTIVLGTDEFRSNEFKCYPNPVNDILTIESVQAIFSVEVYNVAGQKVGHKLSNETKTTFDMSGLSSGAYLVKVIADNEVKMIKILKR